MRKLFVMLGVFALAASCAQADTLIAPEAFPDETFRELVRNFDTNSDGTLQDSEIAAVSEIDVSEKNIASMEGVQIFTNLEALDCGHNPIENLNLSSFQKLRVLFCTNTKLQALDVSKCPALQELYCYVSSLDVLDVSANTALVSLDCQENNISVIDLSHNPSLQFVDVGANKITSLNLSNNPKLKWLYCRDLNLSGLDVSNLPELRRLWCWNDGLTALDLSANASLAELICHDNPIAGTISISSFIPYDELFAHVGKTENITSTTAIDAEGNTVSIEASPALVRYSYNTGLDNVKLTVTAAKEEAQGFASCSNGIFEGFVDGNILTWKGIPYAKQPVGSLRWKAPEAPDNSDEVQEAFNYAVSPIQYESSNNPSSIMPRGEECLCLNVWNNGAASGSVKPVMVWIHGGAFNSGGTANPDYDMEDFIKVHDDVVMVSVGYRVGIMGFIDFAHSGLAGGEDYPDSGNLSLLDIVQALRWIKENIRAFGGNPENITVFGHSSGSASIALVMAMPESAGLFQKAILESGAVSMTQSIDDSAALTQAIIQATGASSMNDLLALTSGDLMGLAEKFQALTNFPERDGIHVAENSYEAFARNSANFTVMTGTMADELDYWKFAAGTRFSQLISGAYFQFVQGISQVSSEDAKSAEDFVALYMAENDADEAEAIAEFFNDLLFRGPTVAELDNSAGGNYLYYWQRGTVIPGIGACHGLDIQYVLNKQNAFIPFGFEDDFAASVQALWVNFAKTGTPSETWPAYNSSVRAAMIIDDEFSVSNGHLAEHYALIAPLLKYGMSGRELISAVAALGTESNSDGGDTPATNETPSDTGDTPTADETPSDTGDTPTADEPQSDTEAQTQTNDPGSAGGGCDSGFAFPVIAAVIIFSLKRRT